MLFITDFIELKSAERIYLMGALAKLRQMPLPELVKQLDIKNFHTETSKILNRTKGKSPQL